MERFILAAQTLLQRHYTEDEALERAKALTERWRLDETEEMDPEALVISSLVMSMAEEPWWDSEDVKVRAINQLENDTLLLPSMEAFAADVEAALGRPLGEDQTEREQTLNAKRYHILAELKGEPPPPPNPLETMLALLQGSMGELGENLQQEETFDDFGAPSDGELEEFENEGGALSQDG